MTQFHFNDRVHVEGLSTCTHGVGTIIDLYVSVKGQSIKVQFDDPCTNDIGNEFNLHWINVYDPAITVTLL